MEIYCSDTSYILHTNVGIESFLAVLLDSNYMCINGVRSFVCIDFKLKIITTVRVQRSEAEIYFFRVVNFFLLVHFVSK